MGGDRAHFRPAGSPSSVRKGGSKSIYTPRVRLRISACPVIERGMYFTFRRQRYDVLYGYPIYNRRGWLELYCRLVVEDSVPGI